MSLNSVLEIGKSGLNIYQMATDVTSQNIANVNTPGYSRQQVVLETAPSTTANGFPLGTGVRIASVDRIYDGLLQQQLVTAQSTQGNDTTKSNVLQQIEPTFNEVVNDGLGAAITNFFGSWQDLTLNPSGSTERQAVLSRAQILVDNFHSVSTSLNNAISTQDQSLAPLTADISAKLKNIAQLNGQIQTTQMVSGNANELKDQRDQLIRDLSTKMGITTSEPNPPDGTVNITSAGGEALVTGNQYASMYTDNVGGTTPNDIYVTAVGNPPPANTPGADTKITATVGGANNSLGELGATLALRDTIIPGYLGKVDELANQIVTQVNNNHNDATTSTAGVPANYDTYDLTGAKGGDFFLNAGTTAASITLNIIDPNKIAAATTPLAPGDNSNALNIANMQNTPFAFASGNATLNGYYNSLVSTVGLDVQSAKNTVAQDNAFTQQLTTLQQSNSGVSLDEELTNLIKYQRSYQASAKLITTATDMMDTVIGLIH
jgi:flagellar hook-associated protein 1 FlgK